MSYKTILVHVNESKHSRERIRLAASLAMQEGAHLIGAGTMAPPPEIYRPGSLVENAGSLDVYVGAMRKRTTAALAEYEAQADKSGVMSFEKRLAIDDAGAGISLHARYSDLVVLGQTDPDEPLPSLRDDFPEYVIMNSGRPVLVVPYAGRFERVGSRVLVAWDASMSATRAVTAALPLLKRAGTVHVGVFNPKISRDAHGEQPGADIALYLARHGVKVDVSQETTGPDTEVGGALLSRAADMGADLMVAGCHGHSRFRELLVGGVTRTLVQSMTVPTLMVH